MGDCRTCTAEEVKGDVTTPSPKAMPKQGPLALWGQASASEQLKLALAEEDWTHVPTKKSKIKGGALHTSLGQWQFQRWTHPDTAAQAQSGWYIAFRDFVTRVRRNIKKKRVSAHPNRFYGPTQPRRFPALTRLDRLQARRPPPY